MRRKYIMDPVTCIEAFVTAFTFIAVANVMIIIARPGSAFVFFALGILFAVIAVRNGRSVVIGEDGVYSSFFGLFSRYMSWDDIEETGVAGMRIFFKPSNTKAGDRYIYLVPRKLDDQERFSMILNWPPKDGIYLRYSSERYSAIRYRWDKEIIEYNAGELKFDKGET